jgi:LysR family transcriptional regulator, transcriptional activator of the cysJI operon
MENFKLKVFRLVAKNLSFTKAANELFITQPAITKNIQALENELGLRLFNRKGNRIYLTAEGLVLLEHVEKVFNLELKLEDSLNSFKENPSGSFRLGASTTIAQYVIPPVLAKFHNKFPDIKLSMFTGNTEQIAESLLRGEIDLGIVEGRIKNKDIHYLKFIPDELVAITGAKNTVVKANEITVEKLAALPLVLRERGSGTLDVIEYALKSRGIILSALNIQMYLGSTEAIKLYLEHDDCIGFVSIRSLDKEIKAGTHRIIKVKNFRIKRTLDFITPQGLKSSRVALQFIKIAKSHYNQK